MRQTNASYGVGCMPDPTVTEQQSPALITTNLDYGSAKVSVTHTAHATMWRSENTHWRDATALHTWQAKQFEDALRV